jgi:mono/diheme cytochrome c family protein
VRAAWPTRLALLGVATALLAGCGRSETPDLVHGKSTFVQKCGSCHTLKRAQTQGKTGPDLDSAFRQGLKAGMNRKTVEGVVHDQISHVRRGSVMPKNLVKGSTARDVAAYVALVAARPGQDTGALAQAGAAGATNPKDIFTASGCGSCHTLGKAGTSGTVGPKLDDLKTAAAKFGQQTKQTPQKYVEQSILNPTAFTVPGFPKGVMPSYQGRLKPKQVQALVKYLLGG